MSVGETLNGLKTDQPPSPVGGDPDYEAGSPGLESWPGHLCVDQKYLFQSYGCLCILIFIYTYLSLYISLPRILNTSLITSR